MGSICHRHRKAGIFLTQAYFKVTILKFLSFSISNLRHQDKFLNWQKAGTTSLVTPSGYQVPGNIQETHSQDLHGQRFHLTWSQPGRVQAPRGSTFSSTGKAQGVRGNRQIYRALEIARETSALRKLKAPAIRSHTCVAGDLYSWIFALHLRKDRLTHHY